MTTNTLMLRCFGAPRLERAGQRFVLTRRRTLALLVYLAVTGRPHSREALATLLWPELDWPSARAQFRRELFRLKAATGAEYLLVDREQVAMQELAVDVHRFRQHLQTVASHGHAPDQLCAPCERELEAAAALYDDGFLVGFNLPDSNLFDEWQFFQSEELREEMGGALRTLIAWRANQGRPGEALPLARRWLSFDPLHEPAQRTLMRLYSEAGQHAAALRQYELCVRLLDEELGVEPEPDTVALYERIRTRQLAPAGEAQQRVAEGRDGRRASDAAGSRQTTPMLRTYPTPLVGRTRELEELATILTGAEDSRLLTITGPGGIGKSHLAAAAGRQLVDHFQGAVTFVSLASLAHHDELAATIGRTLGVEPAASDDTQDTLLAYLRRQRMLLILDNFEQLLPEGATLIATILQSARDVRLLITSRERLNLSGERVYPLDGLTYSQRPEADGYRATLGYEAMMLLLQRAQLVRPSYEPQENTELAALSRICRLVQGMPLALVMAAGWLQLLSPAEIAAEIERNLDFLESDMQDLPPRQRSVRAVFTASWQLLDEPARQALVSLSVFRGSFSREAAQAVSGASLRVLLRLVNQSWLQAEGGTYQLHELVRQYLEERLRAEPGRWEAARERHAGYYARFLQAQATAMKGSDQQQAFAAVGAARDNVFLAWEWWQARGELSRLVQEMLPALYCWHEAFGRNALLFPYLQQALAALPAGAEPQQRATLLAALSGFFRDGHPLRFAFFVHVFPSPPYDKALQEQWQLAAEAVAYPPGFWGVVLATAYATVCNAEAGLARLEALLAHFRADDQRWEIAFSLQQIASLLLQQKDSEDAGARAAACLDEAFALFSALGDTRESAYTLRVYGLLYQKRQGYHAAIEQWRAAYQMLAEAGDQFISTAIGWQIGDAYLQLGEFDSAFAQYQAMSQRALATQNRRFAGRLRAKESLESARYGDLAHAWQTRREALTLAQQANDLFAEAWNTWEMGELYRLEGEQDAAREWFERAHVLFERSGEQGGLAAYYRGLGDLALDAGQAGRARAHFARSLEQAQSIGHLAAQIQAHCGLGLAELALGQHDRAQRHLAQALRLAQQGGDRGLSLALLAASARLQAAECRSVRAVALARYVAGHCAAWRQTKREAHKILGAAQAGPDEREGESLVGDAHHDLANVLASVLADLDRDVHA